MNHAATVRLPSSPPAPRVAVFGRADAALYEAKRSGRDRVVLAAGVAAPASDETAVMA